MSVKEDFGTELTGIEELMEITYKCTNGIFYSLGIIFIINIIQKKCRLSKRNMNLSDLAYKAVLNWTKENEKIIDYVNTKTKKVSPKSNRKLTKR